MMSLLNNFSALDADPPRLTARQQQVLALIRQAIERTGAPPTRAEIAAELGFASANAAEDHLRALAKKGVIELVSGTSRGIRLRPGAGPAASEAALSPSSAFFSSSLSSQGLARLALPLVGRVAAGSPILAQEHIEHTYACDPGLFSQQPDYLLRVRGMSMQGAGIRDGDLLAVRQAREAKNGQIVVARLGEEVTVKRFHRHPHQIELRAENPDFSPIFVHPGEPFELEGLAVGLIRSSLAL
ncbi:MAG: repressor LexA [Polaromonas sp.]|nr:repressor LexA [Polaromonas sp.]